MLFTTRFCEIDLLNQMEPISYGGGMNAMYLMDGYVELREVPTKFEAGTQNIPRT